jgi:hypothetical protein
MSDPDFGCEHCAAKAPQCKIHCTYAFLVGVSGAASFLSWKEGWHGDNGALFYMSADPAAVERHIFAALGYAYEGVDKDAGGTAEVLRERIIASINAGRPVLGYGVVGPPEPALITGYDESGEVLVGWSFFQNMPEFSTGVEFEPSGCFRKRDWYKDTQYLILIGEKTATPPLRQTYEQALRWMVEVARNPMSKLDPQAPEWYRQRYNGLAAYQAWADQLLHDDEFAEAEEARLREMHEVHNNVVGGVAEARWYGSVFLAEATHHVHPRMAEGLLRAAACYAGEHELMWRVWDILGGNSSPSAHRKFADPALRRQLAALVLQARDKDAEATAQLEGALAEKGDHIWNPTA